MSKPKSLSLRIVPALLFPFLFGAIIMLLLGYSPTQAYLELLKGAFVGKFNFGTTLEKSKSR